MKKLSSTYLKLSVAPESGADATTYWLVPSVTQVKRKADGTHLPEYVSCEAMAKTGDENPVTGIGTIKFTLTYKTGSSSIEFLYASRIIVTSDMAAIVFKQYVGGSVVDTKTVMVVDDGKNGENGLPGPAGERGRMPFPSGAFDLSVTYTATDSITPIVYYESGKMYYVMNKSGSVTGLNPAEDYAQNGNNATWIPFENYKAIFTEILMANFAKLASAVFFGDYMFSQQGIDTNGEFTTDYGGFNAIDPYNSSNSFRPSICLNFKTGDVYAGSGKIKFSADGSGYLASEKFAFNPKGQILANIVPVAHVILLLASNLVNYDAHKLLIDDVIDKTIVITSKNMPGLIIPDNARLKVALRLSSIYESDVPDGTILGKIHIINNSRILLTMEAQYSQGIHSVFAFPSRSDSSSINVSLGFTSIKVKAGGSLEAYVIKNESGIGNVSLLVLNPGDFEQIDKALIINGVTMCGPGDIITKSFGSNSIL